MLGKIRCLFLAHAPNRRQVKKTANGDYIGYCHYCNGRIRRIKRDKWVRDWSRILGRGPKDEAIQDAEL